MSRDRSLDILRGLMLIIMAADHFGEPVFDYVYEFTGYVSAAEGFVFLSGLLVALVYARYHGQGLLRLEQKVWHRAGVIYLYHLSILLMVFVFTVGSTWAGAYWHSFARGLEAEPIRGFLSGMVLAYQPSLLDILPMYVVFMLAAPLALRLMLTYPVFGTGFIVSSSLSLWLVAQLVPTHLWLHYLPKDWLVHSGAFNWVAWQLIFILGMALGVARLQKRTEGVFNKHWLIVSIVFASYLCLLRHDLMPTFLQSFNLWLASYVHIARDTIGWLRLLNFVAIVYVIAAIVHWGRQHNLARYVKWPNQWLGFLGQHSLQVFAYHVVVLYAYIPFRWGAWALTENQKWLVLGCFLLSLTLPAWWHKQHVLTKKQAQTKPMLPATPLLGRLVYAQAT